MTSSERVCVVGGGIAGLTAAYFEARKGNQVTILENSPRTGGLLQSDETDFGYFDQGTHIATRTGHGGLDEFLFEGMEMSDFHFFNPGRGANYFSGELSEISPFVDCRSMSAELVATAEQELLASTSLEDAGTLEQLMIARFGSTLYNNIFTHVVEKYMGCSAAKLSTNAINFFDMNRVLAFDSARTDTLKAQGILDNAIGFHRAQPGMERAYPLKGGIGGWIAFLLEKLTLLGVVPETGVDILSICQTDGRASSICTRTRRVEFDHLICSIPTVHFARLASLPARVPKPHTRSTAVYNYVFDEPLKSGCYFVNVYDPALLSGRVTLYQNLGVTGKHYNCSVEVMQDSGFDFDNAGNRIEKELIEMGLAGESNVCLYRAIRKISNGFPVLYSDYVRDAQAHQRTLESYFSNVSFIGRLPGRFFMNEVLAHAYDSVMKR